jgi:hypothetical protein
MLKGNLSTRPFYNETLVSMGLLVVAVIAVLLTVFNVRELQSATAERGDLQAQIDAHDQSAARINAEAARTRQSVDRQNLNLLVLDTREANELIEQRAFSWTVLLGVIEKTLPLDVRLVAISPKVDKGNTKITMNLVTKNQDHLNEFRRALEETNGMFYDVMPEGEQRNDDGTYNVTLAAYYLAPTGPVRMPTTKRGHP